MDMDAIELLEKDHTTIRTLFSDIQSTQDSQELEENFKKLAKLLTLHARSEELVLYPQSITCSGTEDLIEHGRKDHSRGDEMILEINSLAADRPEFKQKVSELQEFMENHLIEEENELFPKVRECLSPEERQELASQLTETKSELAKKVVDELEHS
jgi:hemerythrin superfamily protein